MACPTIWSATYFTKLPLVFNKVQLFPNSFWTLTAFNYLKKLSIDASQIITKARISGQILKNVE